MIDVNQLSFPFELKNYDWSNRIQIGKNVSGTSYKVKITDSKANEYVTIKKFIFPPTPMAYQIFSQEFEKLKNIKNNFLVEYIDSQIGEDGAYIVMQFCEVDLGIYLSKYQWKTPEKVCQTIVNHIVEALTVLRRNKYYSVYVNPKNFFVKDMVIKFCPIGTGRYEINFKETSISSLPLYMAPQAIMSEDLTPSQMNSKAEIWSLGVIAFELAIGSLPFSYHSWETYKASIMHEKMVFPDTVVISQNLKDFIRKCIVKDKLQRADWQAILAHPVIQKHKKQPISKKLTPQMAGIWRKLKLNKQKIESNVLIELIQQQRQQALVLTLLKFEQLCKKQLPSMTTKEIIEMFREYDLNNNNKLDENQLIDIFKIFKIHDENEYVFMRDVAEAIKRKNINVYTISDNFDNNKNKAIDYLEMKSLILSILPDSSQLMVDKVWTHLKEIHGGQITTSNMLQELLRYLPMHESQVKSRAEEALIQLKKALGQQKTDLASIFSYFDSNHDKRISLKEFTSMFNSIVGFQREEEIKMVFNMIDKDNSGFICPKELKQLWKTSS